jgi:hypothetical protein
LEGGSMVGDVTFIGLATELLTETEEYDGLERNWGFVWLREPHKSGARLRGCSILATPALCG